MPTSKLFAVRFSCAICAALALTGGMLFSSGCAGEGGMGMSRDRYVYASTPWQPKTVTLRDTRTGQDFWTMEVPVGKKLVVRFEEGEGSKGAFTPDRMCWTIIDDGDDFMTLKNKLNVPGPEARRLDITLRPSPEMPEGMTIPSKDGSHPALQPLPSSGRRESVPMGE